MRLYKIEITSVPAECDRLHYVPVKDKPGYIKRHRDWKPEGWTEYVASEIEAGRRWSPDQHFFWPSEEKLYRSRSSAQEKVDIVRRWGGEARILEAEVGVFIPVAEANARRKAARDQVRINKLRAKIREIEGGHDLPF